MAMAAPAATQYETVIGLEVHVQLRTQSKLFCACPTLFGQEPNRNTCPVCLAMPGVLPVLNHQAVAFAVMTGLALNCTIADTTKFDRKQYFYPDLPKAYQISQYDQPICENGHLTILGRHVRILRAHLEEDAGKLVHAGAVGLAGSTHSLVDLNRAGVPLLEVVSEPDMRTSEEARTYAETLRHIVRYLGVCDGNLEEGSMRVDANVSIRPVGSTEYGTKTEIKNMNSFRAIQRGIDYEVARQTALVEAGERVIQESRLWNEATGTTASMRSKEEAHDYRYFPEPDLRPLHVSREMVEAMKTRMPELPEARLARFQSDYGLSEYDAGVLVEFKDLGDFFHTATAHTENHKALTNWLMGDVTGYLKAERIDLNNTHLTPHGLAELIALVDAGTISSAAAKKVLPEMLKTGASAQSVVDTMGLAQVTDTGAIEAICRQVIADNPEQAAAFRNGKDKLLGFFVGQVMKASKGAASPELANQLMGKILREGDN